MQTQDKRLDYISDFEEGAVEKMNSLRLSYIMLDSNLQNIVEQEEVSSAALRSLSIARTNLETSLQYAIKCLCLVNEIKK